MYMLYAILIVVGCSLLVRDTGGTAVKLYKRQYRSKDSAEKGIADAANTKLTLSVSQAQAESNPVRTGTIPVKLDTTFTFKHVSYTVQTPAGDKRLLVSLCR
jgi:hypothetical protein